LKHLASIVTVFGVAGFLSGAAPASGQSLGDLAKQTAAEREARTKETPPSKVYTTKDLGPGGAAGAPAAPVELDNDPKVLEALKALRATQSALEGGANVDEFKRYYLDAKVKLDALPASPSAAALQAVGDIYGDVVNLAIARLTMTLSEYQLRFFKVKHASNYPFLHNLNDLPPEGVGAKLSDADMDRAVGTIRASEQVLLRQAADRLGGIKEPAKTKAGGDKG
jgi:hypothetical protein